MVISYSSWDILSGKNCALEVKWIVCLGLSINRQPTLLGTQVQYLDQKQNSNMLE